MPPSLPYSNLLQSSAKYHNTLAKRTHPPSLILINTNDVQMCKLIIEWNCIERDYRPMEEKYMYVYINIYPLISSTYDTNKKLRETKFVFVNTEHKETNTKKSFYLLSGKTKLFSVTEVDAEWEGRDVDNANDTTDPIELSWVGASTNKLM